MPNKQDSGSSHGSVPTIITINNEEGELVDDKLLTKSNGLHKDKKKLKRKEDSKFLDPSSATDMRKFSNLNFDKTWVSYRAVLIFRFLTVYIVILISGFV